MDLILTKLVVALLFGLIRYIFGILPIKVHSWVTISRDGKVVESRRETMDGIVAMIQSFGGGVLFATCFLHMMPEVSHFVVDLRKFGVLQSNYPYSQLVISVGFFTIYFAEELSNWMVSRKSTKNADVSRPISSVSEQVEVLELRTPTLYNKMAFEMRPIETIEKNFANIEKHEKMYLDDFSCDLIVDTMDQGIQTENENPPDIDMEADLDLDTDVNAEIEELIEEGVKNQKQMFRCILVVMAISLHAFFEGLAIGLQRSNKNIWYLFTAVSIHSATVLFIIGSEVVISGTSTKSTLIHMLMLSSTSPFGVLLGVAITVTTDLETSGKSFAILLLEGLSAGTILYITFFETLNREKKRRKCRFHLLPLGLDQYRIRLRTSQCC
ncbi:uncharacterized protein LOC116158660 [Photinus pyralis]|uniref:uncharacterized protein LOC116158660 n=1 Tax=Photinus pyralis TaxID=7054 RepID=UPI001266EE9E|nr:uncharacterized protein LOC116158660 [Photinus pyralis]